MEPFLSEVTEFGISIDVKPVAQNAKDSIVVTLFGIEIPVRFSVFWNAPCDIVVTVSLILTVSSFVNCANESNPVDKTPYSIINFVAVSLYDKRIQDKIEFVEFDVFQVASIFYFACFLFDVCFEYICAVVWS